MSKILPLPPHPKFKQICNSCQITAAYLKLVSFNFLSPQSYFFFTGQDVKGQKT